MAQDAVTPLAVAAAPTQGFSPERLARIDAVMEKAVADGVMAGGQGMIARNGKLVYNHTWGMADREAGKPMSPDALYRIYSMTKPITAVALMMLYEEGLFLLEDPIGNYLPELQGLTVAQEDDAGNLVRRPPARQPTIRDLLRHTAGFSYGLFSNTAVDELYLQQRLFESPTLASFTQRLGTLPLLLEPGSRWHYSVAVDVQGRLVEVLSGQSFGEFLRSRIFEPLGMRDTFFVLPEEKRDRLTQLYSPVGTTMSWNSPWRFTTETQLVPADPEITRPYLDGSVFESGGAGLISSAEDYLRFALMLAGGGELDGVRLLSPRTVEHMRKDHLGDIDSSGLWGMDAFGLGFGIIDDSAGKSGELDGDGAYGWGGAAGTHYWVDPQNKLVGLFMVQSIPHQTPLGKKFRVLTYQALID
jgi:CubicO group peptidase (beta-lactamase class C family)